MTAQRLKGLIPITIIVLVLGTIVYFVRDSSQFSEWAQRRDNWKARCQQYVDQPLKTPEAKACNAELEKLAAEGRANGWMR